MHLFSYKPGSIWLVKMSPQQFQDLAAPLLQFRDEFDESVTFLTEAIEKGEPMELPFLQVQEDTYNGQHHCTVSGHEGRHRMKTASLLGIKEVPTLIYYEAKSSGEDYGSLSPIKDQGCFKCAFEDDAGECAAVLRGQRGPVKRERTVDDKAYILFPDEPGKLQWVEFKREPINWCKVPAVRDAPKRWLKEKGIELDCG